MNKRDFIKTLALAGLSIPASASNIDQIVDNYEKNSLVPLHLNDDFWGAIRASFLLKSEYINLENGYYSMMPQSTLEAYILQIKYLNQHASYYMRTRMMDDKISVRQLLGNFLNCAANEIIITRNTTESMDTIICGIDWKKGDEAIMAEQDYGSMLDMFKQQAKRYGIVNKIVSVPNHPKSDEEIVEIYEKAITPKTKLLMVCHMINITGQILPIKKICAMAHKHGVEVLVDGAHAIAHIDFNIVDLDCDYYGSSLHKWLSVPLGAGLLYVKKEKIAKLWPLFGDSSYTDDDIRKLNHTGTQPIHVEMTIINAINFQNKIGNKRKEDRLRFLQQYWTTKVKDLPNIIMNTPAEAERVCGIANVGVKNMKPSELAKTLLDTYKIWTVAIENQKANVMGCRITPSVYTTTAELDELVGALKKIAS